MGTWVLIRRRRGIGRINPRPAAVICCSLDSSPPIAVSASAYQCSSTSSLKSTPNSGQLRWPGLHRVFTSYLHQR